MAETCDEYLESAVANDSLRSGVIVRMRDGGAAADRLAVGVIQRFSDAAVADDAFSAESRYRYLEAAAASDRLSVRSAGTQRYREAAAAGDRLRSTQTHRYSETAAAGDRLTSHVRERLRDVATIAEAWSLAGATTQRYTDAAIANDLLRSRLVMRFSEAAGANDALRATSVARARLADAGVANDALTGRSAARARLTESAGAGDSLTGTSAGVSRFSDLLFAADRIRVPGTGQAWTAATDTLGMTEYAGVPFLSAASVAGELVGILDSGGAWALAADDDDGDPIAWAISTGLLDFGSDRMKRPEVVYIGYAADDSLQLTFSGTRDGGEEVALVYDMPARAQSAPGSNRFKPGRGLLSRWYRLAIGSADVPATIYSVRSVFLDTTRRV